MNMVNDYYKARYMVSSKSSTDMIDVFDTHAT